MRSLMLALALGLSTLALGACSSQMNKTPAPVSPAAATPTAKPNSHMTMPESTQASMTPHERIAQCNAEATAKRLKGDAIADFLNACVSEQNTGGTKTMQ